ncbi:hypothetical protein M8J75_016217 [Diaphorina citri]|nr:hypothetical protein M8J75_016217 [Diaphorina citri]KAI5734845.1 hypothetical protein M8J77_011105 [Diaphorina citri]
MLSQLSGEGAIFEQGTDEVQSAFKFAMLTHNQNTTTRRFELQAYVDVINTADAFKLSRLSNRVYGPDKASKYHREAFDEFPSNFGLHELFLLGER